MRDWVKLAVVIWLGVVVCWIHILLLGAAHWEMM